jgi:hypothetical protein
MVTHFVKLSSIALLNISSSSTSWGPGGVENKGEGERLYLSVRLTTGDLGRTQNTFSYEECLRRGLIQGYTHEHSLTNSQGQHTLIL